MFAQPCAVNLLAAGRRLVVHFKCSNANIHALSHIQEQLGLNKHWLIHDEPTRWNTSYHLLERLIERRQTICAAEIECKLQSELINHRWQLAEKIVKVLKPFEEATVVVSNEASWAALAISVVNSLVHFLEKTSSDEDEGVRTMKRKMLLSLNNHYTSMEINKLYALPTLLDLQLKFECFFHHRLWFKQGSVLLSVCFISVNKCWSSCSEQWSYSCQRHHRDVGRSPQKQSSL